MIQVGVRYSPIKLSFSSSFNNEYIIAREVVIWIRSRM